MSVLYLGGGDRRGGEGAKLLLSISMLAAKPLLLLPLPLLVPKPLTLVPPEPAPALLAMPLGLPKVLFPPALV